MALTSAILMRLEPMSKPTTPLLLPTAGSEKEDKVFGSLRDDNEIMRDSESAWDNGCVRNETARGGRWAGPVGREAKN
jgi:hypothetical protein